MLQVKKIIGRYLRYPFMAVMLLWALTLPGQEVAVYSFLLHGTTSKADWTLAAAPHGEGQKTVVQQQGVQAFQDAKAPSCLVLDQQQLVKYPLLLAFAVPADEPLPVYGLTYTGNRLLAQLLPITIQPNAP